MNFLKEFVKWFVIINTGIVLVVAINLGVNNAVDHLTLWKIFIASAATALPTTIVYSYEPRKVIKKSLQALIIVAHALVLLAIMILLGVKFGWISLSGHGIWVMVLGVAGVYLCSVLLSFAVNSNDAKQMNEALLQFRNGADSNGTDGNLNE